MKNLIFIVAFIFSFSINADVLLIDRVEAKQGVNVPQKSATMNQVRSGFGDPLNEYPAVGNPPITRWEYAKFIVYFEHEFVISTVLKKSKPTEKSPKPVND